MHLPAKTEGWQNENLINMLLRLEVNTAIQLIPRNYTKEVED